MVLENILDGIFCKGRDFVWLFYFINFSAYFSVWYKVDIL